MRQSVWIDIAKRQHWLSVSSSIVCGCRYRFLLGILTYGHNWRSELNMLLQFYFSIRDFWFITFLAGGSHPHIASHKPLELNVLVILVVVRTFMCCIWQSVIIDRIRPDGSCFWSTIESRGDVRIYNRMLVLYSRRALCIILMSADLRRYAVRLPASYETFVGGIYRMLAGYCMIGYWRHGVLGYRTMIVSWGQQCILCPTFQGDPIRYLHEGCEPHTLTVVPLSSSVCPPPPLSWVFGSHTFSLCNHTFFLLFY